MTGPSDVRYPAPPARPGSPALFRIRLRRHTGVLLVYLQQTYTVTGTFEQCEHAYREAQTYNLLAGWWSLGSLLVLNWVVLLSNKGAMSQLRRCAEQYPGGLPPALATPRQSPTLAAPWRSPAGWYRDPSGHRGQRYWDGVGWTQWTHPAYR